MRKQIGLVHNLEVDFDAWILFDCTNTTDSGRSLAIYVLLYKYSLIRQKSLPVSNCVSFTIKDS